MTRSRYAVAIVLVLALALAVVGAALATGAGPAPGGNSEDIEEFPTATPGSAASSGASPGGSSAGIAGAAGEVDANGTAAASTSRSPFAFDVADISECGETCRDVTASLTNQRSTAASDVTVYTRIFLGNGTDGSVIWQGTRSVGRIDANESVTVTTTVELTVADGMRVRNTGGYITAQSSVVSDAETMTITKQRDVT